MSNYNRKITIVIRAETQESQDAALAAAMALLVLGNVEGADSLEGAAFYFTSIRRFHDELRNLE